jgi:hypothetical protein
MPYSRMSEMCSCVAPVSQHGERIKWQGSGEVPQSIGSLHASFLSWRHRVSQILTALRTLDCEELQRAQIESLFGLHRRAALRLMAPLVSASRNGSWQVDRPRLIHWLEGFEQEAPKKRNVIDSCSRLSMMWKLKTAACWTLKQEVFARNIRSLPAEIAI